MKTFFAVFFGILTAAVVILIGWRLYLRSQASDRAAALRSEMLEVAAGCSDKGYDGDLDDALSSRLDLYSSLLKQAGDGVTSVEMKHAALMNQLIQKGCLQFLHPQRRN